MSGSAWDLSDGLPGDFDGEIVDCAFTFNSRYMNGSVCVCEVTVHADDPDIADELILYSMGKDWEPADRGQSARYTGGEKVKLNRNSSLGQFVTAAGKLMGDSLRTRGEPTEAKTWKGLEFHWDRVPYKDREGTEKFRLLPVALVGPISGGNGKTAATAEYVLPQKIKTALMRVAASVDTHEAFVEQALSIDGVTDEMRPAILSTQDGSIWATMKG